MTERMKLLFASKLPKNTPATQNQPLKLEDFRVGMTVFSEAGYKLEVVSIDSRQRYPIFAKAIEGGTNGRFLPSSLSLIKPKPSPDPKQMGSK